MQKADFFIMMLIFRGATFEALLVIYVAMCDLVHNIKTINGQNVNCKQLVEIFSDISDALTQMGVLL